MKTLLEVVTLATDYLKQKGIGHSRRQAEDLVADALKLQRLQLYTEFDRPLTEKELDLCRQWLQRRGKGEPLPYIHGEIDFYHCHFKITPAVLIPRQETEILIDKITKSLENESLENKELWDICCGSGCIGISLGKKFPQLKVELSDISTDALALAKINSDLNEVSALFYQGDLLQPFAGRKADLIVCNPPYVAEKEYPLLDKEVREYEPRSALVSGPTGLEFYQKLSFELPAYLNKGARVWMEIGTGQGPAVLDLFNHPQWKKRIVEPDWAGHDRFFFLEIE